jgi:signal transduction histidine kinase
LSLIADLLDLSRIELGMETGQVEQVDPVNVLHRAVELVAPRMEKKEIALELDLAQTSITLECDPRDLESVFVNLLTNALKYTTPGGSVKVTTVVELEAFEVSIRDTGIGISAQDLPHIFDKFYRVKSEATRQVVGTGLGLPIVQGIVKGLGGEIDASSELGLGSTFTVKLPIAARG